LCPCKVRNKFLVNFWNCTILLCIPCIYVYIYIYFTSYYRSCPLKFIVEHFFRMHDSSFRINVNEICPLLGFYTTQMVIPYQRFTTTYASPIDPSRWDRQLVPKRRYGITILRCVKSHKIVHLISFVFDPSSHFFRSFSLQISSSRFLVSLP
jgi:hypothetical protein